MNGLQGGHLSPEDLFEFIDQGGSSGPAGRHVMSCPECLFELDFVLLAEAPATREEEAILDEPPGGDCRGSHSPYAMKHVKVPSSEAETACLR